MLPQPAALLPLVAEQLGNREPSDRLLQGLGPGAHHAGERRGHLGAECDLAPPFVLEGVQLLHDLLATLPGVELQRLERRAVAFLEAVAARHDAPRGEVGIAATQVLRAKLW